MNDEVIQDFMIPLISRKLILRGFWIAGIICVLLTPEIICAQFLRLSVDVETELSASSESKLNFGSMDSGIHELQLGDEGMGVFSFSAYENVHITAVINAPEYLIHSSSVISDRLTIDLNAAYANKGENNYRQATPMSGSAARFRVRDRKSVQGKSSAMELCWIYLYGTVNTSNASPGRYEGEVTIRIEYE